jgi:hypothetical protein
MKRLPVVLFSDRGIAVSIQHRLAQTGIDATLNEKPPLAHLWFIPKGHACIRVEVPAGRLEQAEHFLLDLDNAEGALRQAVRCPECSSLRVDYPQYAKHSLLTNLAMGLLAELRVLERDFYCEDCHYAWPKEGTRARQDRPHLAPYYFIEGVEQSRLETDKVHNSRRDRQSSLSAKP